MVILPGPALAIHGGHSVVNCIALACGVVDGRLFFLHGMPQSLPMPGWQSARLAVVLDRHVSVTGIAEVDSRDAPCQGSAVGEILSAAVAHMSDAESLRWWSIMAGRLSEADHHVRLLLRSL